MLHYLSGGSWDPHDVNAIAATCESSIQFWDLRTMTYVVFFMFFASLFVNLSQSPVSRPKKINRLLSKVSIWMI